MVQRSEAEILELIRARFDLLKGGIGIGDDAAVLAEPGCRVASTDIVIEGIDFTRSIPPRFVGWKCLAANVSDIAAMGARARAFLLTLGLPSDAEGILEELLDGIAELARRENVALAGGDLSRSGALVISMTALGDLVEGGPLLRSGARAGDRVYVSRPLGGSAAGLGLLTAGWTVDAAGSVLPPAGSVDRIPFALLEFAGSAIRQHVAPLPETSLGPVLAESRWATACIDISDGLSTDLHHLCRASGCGAIIDPSRVPFFPDLPSSAASLGIDATSAVLHGGEEYALLFTSPLREAELSDRLGRPVYAVGRITEEPSILLDAGSGLTPLEDRGFDHFTR